jgi:hypothetical protein
LADIASRHPGRLPWFNSNPVLTFCRSKRGFLVNVRRSYRFEFLLPSRPLASIVSMDANLFQQSYLNVIRDCRLLSAMHLTAVHHFQRFACHPLWRSSAITASQNASHF